VDGAVLADKPAHHLSRRSSSADQAADKRSIEVELRRDGITVKLSWLLASTPQ